MPILLIAATPYEIAPTLHWLESSGRTDVRPLISGVGLVATIWTLAGALQKEKPGLVINAGVAGALDARLQLGDVVQVISERFGDLGAEEADGRLIDLFDMELLEPSAPPFVNSRLHNPAGAEAAFLPRVHGISVNRVHGTAASIAAVRKQYPDAQVESMEGAAVFYACLLAGVPFLEIRSISNYVEPRNRNAWQLPLAIENLNRVLVGMLEDMG